MTPKIKGIVLGGIALGLAFMLTGCGQVAIDNSLVGLRYESGETQGNKFKECLEPGKSIQTNDTVYPYPNTQREFNMETGGQGSDDKSVTFLDKNGVPMTAVVTISLFLNTSCTPVTVNGKHYKGGTLQVYHELFGKTRHAYFNMDGSYDKFGGQDKGWLYVLRLKVGQPATKLFKTYGTQYEAADLWQNQATDNKLAEQVQGDIEKAVNDTMQTDLTFFKNFHVEVVKIEPPKEFQQSILERTLAQTKADTAVANQKAQVAEQDAKNAVLAAQIAGLGGIENYLKQQLIVQGGNPFQPGWPTVSATK